MADSGVAVLSYENISLGQKASLDVELTAALVDAFAALTGDVNPLHVSDEFARTKGFPSRLAHGLLSAAFFSTIAGTMLPGRDCILQGVKVDFRRPVPAGSKLTLTAVVTQKIDAVRALVLDISARDARGELVLSGKLQAGLLP